MLHGFEAERLLHVGDDLDQFAADTGLSLVRAGADVRRAGHHGMAVQRLVGGGLVGVHVQTGGTDLAGLQRGQQRGLVHVGAAGGIDDHHAVLHLGDVLGADEGAAVHGRRMDGDEVGLGQQLIHLDIAHGLALEIAVLIDVVEKEIEKIYDSYQLPTKVRILIETYLQKVIADEKRKYESELDGLKGQKAALENKRKKLLEAHYSDAIPLDLMKTEQQKIAKELAAIDHEIDLHNITFEQISANLDMVLDIVENCGEAYRNASDTIKKLMNQAIFEKFYISNGPEDEFGVKLTFKAPYDQILDPIKEDLSQINTALKRKPEAVDGLADKAKGHIHDFFGCGPNLGQNKNPYSNESDFFNPNSSSKDLMVELRGIEPLSESNLEGTSPGAVCYLHSLSPAGTNTLRELVAS